MLLSLRVDGRVVDAVRSHQEKGFVALPRGVHLVETEYVALTANTSLHFALRPHRVTFSGNGWRADGIDEDRLINETVHLSRVAADLSESDGSVEPAPDEGTQQFPSYLRVTRTLRFDLDWTVNTTVTRVSPREGGVTLAVPLLLGEHVTTAGIKVQDDEATVSLGHTENERQWQSRLDKNDALRLTAPALAERAEVWRIEVGPSWHARWEGVPETLIENEGDAVFEFHPLPGETLLLTMTSPLVVEGRVRAIDRVTLNHKLGVRASEHSLEFGVRASQGGEHVVTLPSTDMELLMVTRDGQSLNLSPVGSKLTLPVSPGEQSFTVKLRDTRDVGVATRLPVFDLGLPVANIDIAAELSEQRWLLASFGPSVGPAVLYWGELVVAVALAALLSVLLVRRGWTSVRFHQWLLLVLGFSTFSWVVLAVVVFWLVALDWRHRRGAAPNWSALRFNTVQLALVVLSFVALLCLISAIPSGLLGVPDMGVVGHHSYGKKLLWFVDQSEGTTPTVLLVSLPMWVYRVAMLVWALWLVRAATGWLRHGLAAWTQGGYWRTGQLAHGQNEASAKT